MLEVMLVMLVVEDMLVEVLVLVLVGDAGGDASEMSVGVPPQKNAPPPNLLEGPQL